MITVMGPPRLTPRYVPESTRERNYRGPSSAAAFSPRARALVKDMTDYSSRARTSIVVVTIIQPTVCSSAAFGSLPRLDRVPFIARAFLSVGVIAPGIYEVVVPASDTTVPPSPSLSSSLFLFPSPCPLLACYLALLLSAKMSCQAAAKLARHSRGRWGAFCDVRGKTVERGETF